MSEREFWIFKGTSCFADELKPSDDLDALVKHRSADGFYDLVSENDTIEGGIHVIEYSAYEQMKQERDELKAKLDRLNKIIHLAQSQCGLPDPIEACRTVLNTLRSNCNVQCGSTASESQLEDAVSEIIRVWEWTFLPENEYTQMVGDIRDVFDCLLKRLKRHPNESQHHCGTEGTK